MASGQNLRGSKVRSERLILRAWISLFFSADPRSAGGVRLLRRELFRKLSFSFIRLFGTGGSGRSQKQVRRRERISGHPEDRRIRSGRLIIRAADQKAGKFSQSAALRKHPVRD